MDTDFSAGTRSIFARAVSAEVRAAMAARRLTIRQLASGAGFASHNYLAIRLRDEKPLTLDDVERICVYLDEEPAPFVDQAYAKHAERLFAESMDARARVDAAYPEAELVLSGIDEAPEVVTLRERREETGRPPRPAPRGSGRRR